MAAATEAKTVHSAVVTCFNVITSHSLLSFCYLTIEATYTTISGETKTSLLLTSGWWGLSHHFHYVPEILTAFFWTVPALFNHFLSYFYVVFLTILLFDRAKRDDDRCRSKYGKYWKLYCKKVPYKNIPEIY